MARLSPDRVTSRAYRRPYRPRAVRAVNLGCRLMGPFGRARLHMDHLLDAARRAEGREDFGSDAFHEPMRRLLEAIDKEARLNPVGRLITRTRLLGVLRNRLRAQALFNRHPHILDTPIRSPVVITGLQRTGTTLLHRLLGADPRFRCLMTWEALNPAPLSVLEPDRVDPRIKEARKAERGLAYLAPDFFAVHPCEAESPEEEVLLLDHSLRSTVAEATMRVPSFSRWLEAQDQTPAYETLRRLLQLLEWQRSSDRWLLKTPHHMEWIETLVQVFPDVKIIQTHRDPLQTVASFCSMIAHGRGVMSDHVDPQEVGREWSTKVARMLQRASAARDVLGDGCFLDVMYEDLVAHPLREIRRVYRLIGMDLPDAVAAQIQQARAASPQHRYGRHVYALEDFGLTSSGLADRYAAYREAFDLAS